MANEYCALYSTGRIVCRFLFWVSIQKSLKNREIRYIEGALSILGKTVDCLLVHRQHNVRKYVHFSSAQTNVVTSFNWILEQKEMPKQSNRIKHTNVIHRQHFGLHNIAQTILLYKKMWYTYNIFVFIRNGKGKILCITVYLPTWRFYGRDI